MKRSRVRWLLIAAAAFLLISGFARLRFDAEVLSLLPEELPVVQGLKLQQEHFANARDLVITLNAPNAPSAESHAVEIARRLRLATNLVTRVVWTPPWQERPQEAAELIAHLWLNQPPEEFAKVLARLEPANAAAAFAESRERLATSFSPEELGRLSYDPLGLMQLPASVSGGVEFGSGNSWFASPDGTFRIVLVTPRDSLRNYRRARAWLDKVAALLDGIDKEQSSKVTLRFTGGPAFLAEIAEGMERDMQRSALGTFVIVAALFWIAHRRLRPMFWLLALLALSLAGTLALGGLLLGELNIVSIGFAAILLGLAADYGLVLYQEMRAHGGDVSGVRRAVAPGIWWSALTTASAFALLNFGGLPGLAQLGTLVALGILLSAAVMLGLFPAGAKSSADVSAASATSDARPISSRSLNWMVWLLTGVFIVVAMALLWNRWPVVDASPEPLRPLNSEAYAAMDELQQRLDRDRDPVWVIVSGTNETEVASRLAETESLLAQLRVSGSVESFQLPGALWPNPGRQQLNSALAAKIGEPLPALLEMAGQRGFESTALAVAQSMLATWRAASVSTIVFWPTNDTSRWALDQLSARSDGLAIAAGMVRLPSAGSPSVNWSQHSRPGIYFAGWELLGSELLNTVEHRLVPMVGGILLVLLVSLALAFRRIDELLLSVFSIAFSGLLLLLVMRVAGWSWNLMNLMALPLLLGAGVDYSIHMQLGLRRVGDVLTAWRSVGRALLLCAATTTVGFGSLAWSSNAGMASLGKVCATGVACAAVSGIFLLPLWWRATAGRNWHPASPAITKPSGLYRAGWWKLALAVARIVPRPMLIAFGIFGARVYRVLNPARFVVVRDNLLPVFDGDAIQAASAARRNFDEFGRKLADLWRSEAGVDIAPLVHSRTGWEKLGEILARGRGVLLVTPHLGNWEFGAPLVTRRGVPLNVITLSEPGGGFTELRRAARYRAGVTTHVIGDNPFAFIEIIKRLQAGEVVALLVDRPPAASSVRVELFGRPFDASIAVAELARAAGAAIVPVTICRDGSEYAAEILPEIVYDRAALNSREARAGLTAEILRAFVPAIRKHPEQWFHFVPIWSAELPRS